MRAWLGRASIAAVGVIAGLTLSFTAFSQTRAPQAGSPQPQTGGVRTARAADGKPNLNGVYQAISEAYWDIEPHGAAAGPVQELGASYAMAGGLGIVDGPLPYKPDALAKKKENLQKRLQLDPEMKCYLPGVPRAIYMPYPFKIVQTTSSILMSFPYANTTRVIDMTKVPKAPVDTWMGYSSGKWDKDTLVVDSRGFNDKTWFDRAGNFHSEALTVVERFTPVSADVLNYEATMTDPNVFTRPWKISMNLYRRIGRDAEPLEFNCVEYVEEMMYGDLVKKPTK